MKNINEFHLDISLLFLIIITGLFVNGIIFNKEVINANNGKMPMLTNNIIDTDTHFSYNNSKDINLSIFADNYKIKNYLYSIGDFYIFSSALLFLLFFIIILISYIKSNDNQK